MRGRPSRRGAVIVLSAVFLLTAVPLHAVTRTWAPPPDSDGNWFSANNWQPNGVPASNADFTFVLNPPTPIIEGAAITGGTQIGVANFVIGTDAGGNPYSLTSVGSTTITPGGSVYVAGGYFRASSFTTTFTIQNYLEISAGGTVESYQASLAPDPNAPGSPKAVVRGVDTIWDSTRIVDDSGGTRPGRFFTVGDSVLELTNSATIYSENVVVGSTLSNTLVTVTNGALWDVTRPSAATTLGNFNTGGGATGMVQVSVNTNGRIAALAAAIGARGTTTLTITDTGQFNVSGTNVTQKTVVGTGGVNGGGTGILEVKNGGTVTGHNASLGDHLLGTGTVTVTGQGSSWTLASAGTVTVGRVGNGTLNITNGGHVITGTLAIGGNSSVTASSVGGTGNVTVSGAGSLLSGTGSRLYVGTDGTGSLTIENGGQYNGTSLAYVGNLGSAFSNNGHGTLLITDPGSSFVNSNDLRIANGGTVTLANGATASTFPGLQIGEANPARSSSVTVKDPGSNWNMGLLTVGGNAPASFFVFQGGHATATSTVSVNTGGAVTVNGVGSALASGNMNVQGQLFAILGGSIAVIGDVAVIGSGNIEVHQPTSTFDASRISVGTTSSASLSRFTFDGDSSTLLTDLRLATVTGSNALVTQTAGTINVGAHAVGGVVLFGPGTSTYTLEGGTLAVKNQTTAVSGRGIQASAAATYTVDLAGGTIRASGDLTSGVNGVLRAGTTTTFDSNGFSFVWAGNLTGSGQLRKIGLGSLSLTGATVPTAGSLILEGGTVNFSGTPTTTIPFLGGDGSTMLSLTNTSLITTSQSGHAAALASLLLTNSTLDLSNGELSISTAGTPTATVVNYIKSARNNGLWNLKGLTSSSIGATPNTSLGYVVGDGFTRVKFTYFGDLTLDGEVNADDYAQLDRAMAAHLPAAWSTGDVNYDNVVNASDVMLTDVAFVQQGGALSTELLAARESQFGAEYVADLLLSIPEPGLAAWSVVGFLFRKRRRAAG